MLQKPMRGASSIRRQFDFASAGRIDLVLDGP
jgi:hypothetical protein